MSSSPLSSEANSSPVKRGIGWWLVQWSGWITLLLLPTGVTWWAIVHLLGLPELPDCRGTYASLRSSADQLYCAEMIANGQSHQDLIQAIRLVNRIDAADPFYEESDRLKRQWSERVIQIAETTFQEGKLEEAIDILQDIPFNLQDQRSTQERITHWQSTWDKAEIIYEDARSAIQDEAWYDVLNAARELWLIGNRYWATVKYQELMQELQSARESRQAQSRTRPIATPPTDWLQSWEREQEKENQTHLQVAQKLAHSGNKEGLAAAITEAYQVLYGSSQYDEAQRLIETWEHQLETLEDRPYLERALALAGKGDEASLEDAIAEARQIQWGRSLYEDANRRIEEWTDQIQRLRTQSQVEQLQQLDATSPDETLNSEGARSQPP